MAETNELTPGSKAARKMGCKCPVVDNAHGKGAYGGGVKGADGETLYWINEDCPLHYPMIMAQEATEHADSRHD